MDARRPPRAARAELTLRAGGAACPRHGPRETSPVRATTRRAAKVSAASVATSPLNSRSRPTGIGVRNVLKATAPAVGQPLDLTEVVGRRRRRTARSRRGPWARRSRPAAGGPWRPSTAGVEIGISRIVVMPPAAAAAVAEPKSSRASTRRVAGMGVRVDDARAGRGAPPTSMPSRAPSAGPRRPARRRRSALRRSRSRRRPRRPGSPSATPPVSSSTSTGGQPRRGRAGARRGARPAQQGHPRVRAVGTASRATRP